MVLAPRHPERFDRVAELLRSRKQRFVRRSQWIAKPAKLKLGTVVLLDSIGELASVYSLASVAFVGGSLTPNGGHNPLEPAQFGVPVVMGPYYENFRAIVNRLLEAEALKIAQPENLASMLALLLLQDQNLAAMMGVRGLEVFDNQTGATDRAAEAILGLLNPPGERASAARSDAKP